MKQEIKKSYVQLTPSQSKERVKSKSLIDFMEDEENGQLQGRKDS